jgi:hypothetical protein
MLKNNNFLNLAKKEKMARTFAIILLFDISVYKWASVKEIV